MNTQWQPDLVIDELNPAMERLEVTLYFETAYEQVGALLGFGGQRLVAVRIDGQDWDDWQTLMSGDAWPTVEFVTPENKPKNMKVVITNGRATVTLRPTLLTIAAMLRGEIV